MAGSIDRVSAAAALAAAAFLVLPAGCGGGAGEDGDADSASPQDQAAKLWFTAGEQFETVERDPAQTPAAPKPAVEALLEGPTAADRAGDVATETQIPQGTSLEGLEIDSDGSAVVKLSPEFSGGIPASPAERDRNQQAELDARVAQVTYTLTQFKQVEEARVVSGGVPVAAGAERGDFAEPKQGPKPVIKPRGAKLAGTRQVQTKLAKLGYLPKQAVDGLAGYRTQQAVIAFQSWSGLQRDGVVGPMTAAALADARRPKPRAGGPARRIEVYRERGVTLLVEGGRTKRAIHTSSGAPGTITPSGRYSVFRKELQSWSVPFQTWLPYASYFNQGIAFHEYADVPTYPASHGCVRVPAPEAKGLYRFAALGTVVVVI